MKLGKKPPEKAPEAVALGLKIKDLRESRGWTQPQLAELVDLTDGAIKMIETGRSYPKPRNLRLIASEFGMTAGQLIDAADGAAPAANDPKTQSRHQSTHIGAPIGRAHGPKAGELSPTAFTHPTLADAAVILNKLQSADPQLRAAVLAVLFENPDILDTALDETGGKPKP